MRSSWHKCMSMQIIVAWPRQACMVTMHACLGHATILSSKVQHFIWSHIKLLLQHSNLTPSKLQHEINLYKDQPRAGNNTEQDICKVRFRAKITCMVSGTTRHSLRGCKFPWGSMPPPPKAMQPYYSHSYISPLGKKSCIKLCTHTHTHTQAVRLGTCINPSAEKWAKVGNPPWSNSKISHNTQVQGTNMIDYCTQWMFHPSES